MRATVLAATVTLALAGCGSTSLPRHPHPTGTPSPSAAAGLTAAQVKSAMPTDLARLQGYQEYESADEAKSYLCLYAGLPLAQGWTELGLKGFKNPARAVVMEIHVAQRAPGGTPGAQFVRDVAATCRKTTTNGKSTSANKLTAYTEGRWTGQKNSAIALVDKEPLTYTIIMVTRGDLLVTVYSISGVKFPPPSEVAAKEYVAALVKRLDAMRR